MSGQAAARWRSLAAGLCLVFGLLPLLVPPRRADPIPACCRVNGAHHCALRPQRVPGGVPAATVTALCDAPAPKDTISYFAALQSDLPRLWIRHAAPCEVQQRPAHLVTTAVVAIRASRAPPLLV